MFIDRPTELAKFKISKQTIGSKNKHTLEKAVIYRKKEIPTQRGSARKILFSEYQAQIFRQLSLVLRTLFKRYNNSMTLFLLISHIQSDCLAVKVEIIFQLSSVIQRGACRVERLT